MSNSKFSKEGFKSLFGFESVETDDAVLTTDSRTTESKKSNKKDAVRVYQTNDNQELRVIENGDVNIEHHKPTTYEEAQQIVFALRQGKAVVLNLEDAAPDRAKNLFDFLNGAVCAIDGKAEKLTRSLYLLAPRNIKFKAPRVKSDESEVLQPEPAVIK